MTTTATTATAAPDNGNGTATEPATETTTSTTPPPATDGTDETGDSTVTTDDGDEAGRVKFYQRLAHEQEAELKKLRSAEEERQRAEMTEADRLKADLAARDLELATMRSEALRAKVAGEHSLPAELAERLRGDTEEELTEDAKRLSELVGKRPPAPPAGDAGIGVGGTPPIDDPLTAYRKATASRGY